MVKKYALILKGKIIKFKNVPDDDTLVVTKLLPHGYLPVTEDDIPLFDYSTQSLSDSYEISADKVTRKWTVTEIPFEQAKRIKEEEIKSKTVDYVRAAFDNNNEDLILHHTLIAKKAKFMTALTAATSNIDLRDIDVEYEKAVEKKKLEVM